MIGIALASLLTWWCWSVFGADKRIPGQFSPYAEFFLSADHSLEDKLQFVLQSVQKVVFRLPGDWKHYLFLNSLDHPAVYGLAYGVLGACLVALGLRAVRLQFDAVYVCGYLAMMMLWGQPEATVRFLHPVIMLILIQPMALLFVAEKEGKVNTGLRGASVSVVIVLVGGALWSQMELIDLRDEAREKYPQLVHSFEYYDLADREMAVNVPSVQTNAVRIMSAAAKVVPADAAVAAVKHEAFMLFAAREGNQLTTIVPYLQQLCNLRVRDTEFVLVTDLNSGLTPEPRTLVEEYASITASRIEAPGAGQNPGAVLLMLDKEAIEQQLENANYECSGFRLRS
jgi:hypothetical protein